MADSHPEEESGLLEFKVLVDDVVLNVSGPSGDVLLNVSSSGSGGSSSTAGGFLPNSSTGQPLGVWLSTAVGNKESTSWDPTMSTDWSKETASPQCLLRIKRDIMSIYNDPPPGIFIVPDESDMTLIHALITGSFDTPYEGGFFYFLVRCPPDYPIHPPRVKLMTTGENRVRFNPNLYKNGKVCLSILGTWTGPSWSPAQSLSSVLLSIQSLMNEKPYFNEPGFERERVPGASNTYNKIICHETIRVAVCDMLEETTCDSRNCPKPLKEVMEKSFPEYYEYYTAACRKYIHQPREQMLDPFGENRGYFDYSTLLKRLQNIKEKIDARSVNNSEDAGEAESHSEESDSS